MAFIRIKVKNDIEYEYLVENYRENGKVRQRVLKYLGPVEPMRKTRTRYEVQYLVRSGAELMDMKISPGVRRAVQPDALAWHEPATGRTFVFLDRHYRFLKSMEPFFKAKLTEEQLIKAIIISDVHESLHHVIWFHDDKRNRKAHAAIRALLGKADTMVELGCFTGLEDE